MAWRSGRLVAAILASFAFATVASAQGPWEPDLRVITGEKKFGSVALECPVDGNGTLILFSGNRNGVGGRLRVVYEGDVGVLAATDLGFAAEGPKFNPFNPPAVYDLKDLEPELLNLALKLIDTGNSLLNEVCNGSPEAKQRYRELLDSNLSILGLSPEDYPSDF